MESLIFDFAKQKNIEKVIDLLKNESININVINEDKYNLLMISIFNNINDLSLYLINQGIDLNHQDKKGQTILHHIALYYNEEVLMKVLEEGVDVNIEDNYGNQALWTAVFNDKGFGGRLNMIKFLLKYGANPNHLNNAKRTPKKFAETTNNINVLNLINGFNPTR